MGHPYRLKHLARALQHIQSAGDAVWFTTAGAINDHYRGLGL
jgi:allantoinase